MRKPTKTSAKKRSPKPRLPQPAVIKSDPIGPIGAETKQARVIAMLQSASGATITSMMQQTGWQQHSVRGFLAGVVRKKLKLKLSSKKIDGNRVYRIDSGDKAEASRKQSKRRAA